MEKLPLWQLFCPIWAYTCQAQRPGMACFFSFFLPPLFSRFQKDLNTFGDQFFCLFFCISNVH